MTEYPNLSGFKVAGPSQEAAMAVSGTSKTVRAAVLRTLIQTTHGMTADEIAAELRLSILTVRPRVSELHRLGVILKTDRRGRNDSGMSATVWVPAKGEAV